MINFSENIPEEATALLNAIQSTFLDIPLPGDGELLRPDSYSWQDIQPFLAPKWITWQEVPSEIIKAHYDVLPFFSPKGYRFYLPAFMSLSLSDPKAFNVFEFTRYSLPPTISRPAMPPIPLFDYDDPQFAYFTTDELEIAKQFANYFDNLY